MDFYLSLKMQVKNIDKIIIKNLSGNNSKRILDHAKQSTTDALKTSSKRVIQKRAEATGDLIGNKLTNRTTKIFKNSVQNISEMVTNDKEIPKERHISLEERQKIIDNLRTIIIVK